MKFFAKTMLASVISVALVGCVADDPNNKTSENRAPVVEPALIEVNFMESDGLNPADGKFTYPDPNGGEKVNFTFVDLKQGVSDPDMGDRVAIKSIRPIWTDWCLDTEEPVVDECIDGRPKITEAEFGFEILDDKVKVTPTAFAPMLTDEHKAFLHLEVIFTDGEAEVAREVKITVQGEDYAPVIDQVEVDADKVVVAERDPEVVVNLLDHASDRDITDMAQYIVDNGQSGFDELQFPIVQNLWLKDCVQYIFPPLTDAQKAGKSDAEIAEMEAQLAYDNQPLHDGTAKCNGADVTLTVDPSLYADELFIQEKKNVGILYTLTDGIKEVTGVKVVTISGLPPVGFPAFKTAEHTINIQESGDTDGVVSVDLLELTEGDNLEVINFVQKDKAALEFGLSYAGGNTLDIDTHAFFAETQPGQPHELMFEYKLRNADSGDESAQTRTLTVAIAERDFNLFRDDLDAGLDTAESTLFLDPNGFVHVTDLVQAGEGAKQSIAKKTNDIPAGKFPDLIDNRKYYISWWFKNDEISDLEVMPMVTFANGRAPERNQLWDAGWWGGYRLPYKAADAGQWREWWYTHNTHTSPVADPAALGMYIFNNSGAHDKPNSVWDSFKVVNFNFIDTAKADIIESDAGQFLDAALVSNNGQGTVTVDTAAQELKVNTTGKTEPVVVSFPVKAGAVKTGGRYMVEFELPVGLKNFAIRLSNAGGSAMIQRDMTNRNVDANSNVALVMLTEFEKPSGVNWKDEDVTLDFVFWQNDQSFTIKDVRLYQVP
ncbi:hypothetical protein DS2_06716 [Catenovulum agarivorans DS-2]|uniref:Lipoprotein n=1 Tax=Catenovulum agarivorans DS-2 TaxID=1328313 RepID=W7QP26_9ALTE|nr:hypothetical protein [Catenovulum agarivorans]EWH10722.1 hypothetical protein DS2_06716 [Catenovulum agarivorans DS-2]